MKVLYLGVGILFAAAGYQLVAGYQPVTGYSDGAIDDWPGSDPDPFGDQQRKSEWERLTRPDKRLPQRSE